MRPALAGLFLVALTVPGWQYAHAGDLRAGRAPSEPEWVALPEHKKLVAETSFYADIVNHNREPFEWFGDRMTTAHEATHFINAHVRNQHVRATGRRVNAFYLGRNRAVILEEP